MKELKTYISEGFFSNVGANNRIKQVIDTIKNASINDKINSRIERQKFADLLTPILKDIETDINIKKGKFVFEYVRNDELNTARKTRVSLEIIESDTINDVKWIYSNKYGIYSMYANAIAFNVANALYYEAVYPIKDSKLHHSIANTIKVTAFKLS